MATVTAYLPAAEASARRASPTTRCRGRVDLRTTRRCRPRRRRCRRRSAFDAQRPGAGTAAENLGPDCRHHHRVKHLRGWSVRRDPDGSFLWTTPSGRRYRTLRPVLVPVAPDEGPPDTGLVADDLRDVLEHRLRRPVATTPTTRHDDDPPY